MNEMTPEFRAYRESGNTGPWNHDANAPADESNTPREQLDVLAALAELPSWDSYDKRKR